MIPRIKPAIYRLVRDSLKNNSPTRVNPIIFPKVKTRPFVTKDFLRRAGMKKKLASIQQPIVTKYKRLLGGRDHFLAKKSPRMVTRILTVSKSSTETFLK